MVVDELTRDFKEAGGMLVLSFGGLTVEQTEDLRNALAAQGIKFRMVRNSLAKLALAEIGLEFDDGVLSGNTAVAYGANEAAIHAAKIFTEKEVKKMGKITLRAALLEGSVLGASDANTLADIPDRDTMNAMLLGVLSGPARSLVSVLSGVPAAVARVLQAHADDPDAVSEAPVAAEEAAAEGAETEAAPEQAEAQAAAEPAAPEEAETPEETPATDEADAPDATAAGEDTPSAD
jgi:large subunit ribosomal protein L10